MQIIKANKINYLLAYSNQIILILIFLYFDFKYYEKKEHANTYTIQVKKLNNKINQLKMR